MPPTTSHSLAGCIYIKFKDGGSRHKIKAAPYSASTIKSMTPRGVNVQPDVSRYVISEGSKLTVLIQKGRHVCFLAHHMSTLVTGLESLQNSWKFQFKEGSGRSAYVFYEYWETKDTRRALNVWERGKFISGADLAEKLDRVKKHQHHIYLSSSDIRNWRPGGAKRPPYANAELVGKWNCYNDRYVPGVTLTEMVRWFLAEKDPTSTRGAAMGTGQMAFEIGLGVLGTALGA